MNRGIILAISAYTFWGLHPVYWKMLSHVPALEIVSHRILWSLVFFSIIISTEKNWHGLKNKIFNSDNKIILFIPAFLIGSNWALYIWAVNANYIIETSLGYFISPLLSVFLGVVFLKEKLRRTQWFAVIIAGIGVLIMTFVYGQFPWISLLLAGTWGTYGLLRKKSPLSSTEGLTLETGVLVLPAILYIVYLEGAGLSTAYINLTTTSLLIATGILSGLPLIMFIVAARLIKLSLIGILQYIYPTLIFIVGYFIYHEPLDQAKITGFIFIWFAVIIYTTNVMKSSKKNSKLNSSV